MTGILVPFDGSKHSLKALHVACDLAEKYENKLFLLYIIQLDAPCKTPDVSPETYKNAQTIIRKAAAKAKHRRVDYDILDFEYGDPATGILATSKRIKPSTIVMGCRGLTAADAEIFGTASRAVFEHAECTCISVK